MITYLSRAGSVVPELFLKRVHAQSAAAPKCGGGVLDAQTTEIMPCRESHRNILTLVRFLPPCGGTVHSRLSAGARGSIRGVAIAGSARANLPNRGRTLILSAGAMITCISSVERHGSGRAIRRKLWAIQAGLLVVTLCTLAGCPTSTRPKGDAARNAAVVADLNDWWRKATYAPRPEKPGTVTPAHTITLDGRLHNLPKHVQTREEYVEQVKDARWARHRRSIVTGFNVASDTVIVMTNLTPNVTYGRNPIDNRDAQELCHELGGFIWANENRHWGLTNIRIVGANGELLSSRTGLSGKVQ